jgi:hypothetical protein
MNKLLSITLLGLILVSASAVQHHHGMNKENKHDVLAEVES